MSSTDWRTHKASNVFDVIPISCFVWTATPNNFALPQCYNNFVVKASRMMLEWKNRRIFWDVWMSNLLITEVGTINSANPNIITKIVAWPTQLDCFQGPQFFYVAPGAINVCVFRVQCLSSWCLTGSTVRTNKKKLFSIYFQSISLRNNSNNLL